MNWLLLILSSVVFAAACTLLQRILMREDKSDPIVYSVVFQLLVGIFLGVYGYKFYGFNYAGLEDIYPNILLMVILYGLGSVLLYKSLKTTEASVFTIIFSSRVIFTIIASAIFLSEFLNLFQVTGSLVILTGIGILLYQRGNFKINKGFLTTVSAAALFGFANTNDRFLLGVMDLYSYLFVGFIIPPLFIIMLKPNALRKITQFFKTDLLIKMCLLAFLYAIQALLFFKALQIAPNSSQVVTISLAQVPLAVLLSIFLLKEKKHIYQKTFGAIISIVGLYIVGR